MTYSTTNTYQMKRDILTFSKFISSKSHKSDRKFAADMIYGILASGSCRFTDIVDQLHEGTKKVNAVERLAKHLNKGIPKDQLSAYLKTVKTMVPSNPIIHIDDSDVVKPDGYKFERKVFYKGKVISVTELCNRRKGKVHMKSFHKGRGQDAYISHIKVQITASKKNVYDFRVRKLKAINALNFYITAAMAHLARITLKSETNGIKYAVINATDPIKGKVAFHYHRISKGIFRLLSYATEGIGLWFKTKRPKYRQLCFRLIHKTQNSYE